MCPFSGSFCPALAEGLDDSRPRNYKTLSPELQPIRNFSHEFSARRNDRISDEKASVDLDSLNFESRIVGEGNNERSYSIVGETDGFN